MTVLSGRTTDGTCHLRSEVNNASQYLSTRLPGSAAAAAAAASACGSDAGPAWTVSVRAGQQINFTLIDLSASQSRHHLCRVYAALVEERGGTAAGGTAERAQLCVGQQANTSFTSVGNVVNVTLYHQRNRHINYLLKYEGTANILADCLPMPLHSFHHRMSPDLCTSAPQFQ